jgi:hypothetical protein
MTDVHDPGGHDAAPEPPPHSGVLDAPSPRGGRFTPKRLIVTFVMVLAGVTGGTLVANALINHNSGNDQAMGTWMASYGSHYLDVSHDVATVSAATDVASLRPACVTLRHDVARAASDPAMPVTALESQWSVVLSNLSTAADDCVNGIDRRDAVLLNSSQGHLADAAKAYVNIIKAVQQAG